MIPLLFSEPGKGEGGLNVRVDLGKGDAGRGGENGQILFKISLRKT
jgi:hypothetical protein